LSLTFDLSNLTYSDFKLVFNILSPTYIYHTCFHHANNLFSISNALIKLMNYLEQFMWKIKFLYAQLNYVCRHFHSMNWSWLIFFLFRISLKHWIVEQTWEESIKSVLTNIKISRFHCQSLTNLFDFSLSLFSVFRSFDLTFISAWSI